MRAHSAILDGEICCLNPDGTSNFKELLFRREWPFFVAFDLLAVDGEDIRPLGLLTRKRALTSVDTSNPGRSQPVDATYGHVPG